MALHLQRNILTDTKKKFLLELKIVVYYNLCEGQQSGKSFFFVPKNPQITHFLILLYDKRKLFSSLRKQSKHQLSSLQLKWDYQKLLLQQKCLSVAVPETLCLPSVRIPVAVYVASPGTTWCRALKNVFMHGKNLAEEKKEKKELSMKNGIH